MKCSTHEVATAFNSISQFAFSAFSEVSEFCILELENLSLELSSQLWDSKRPGKSENAVWLSQNQINSLFWFKGWIWFSSEICPWRAEIKRCPQMLSDTASFPESFITLSSPIGKTTGLQAVAPVSAGLTSRCFVYLRLWSTLGSFQTAASRHFLKLKKTT